MAASSLELQGFLQDLRLGRALGHFIFSLIGLKRILFTSIFPKALKAPPRRPFKGIFSRTDKEQTTAGQGWDVKTSRNMGAGIITNTTLVVSYYNYGLIYPKTQF